MTPRHVFACEATMSRAAGTVYAVRPAVAVPPLGRRAVGSARGGIPRLTEGLVPGRGLHRVRVADFRARGLLQGGVASRTVAGGLEEGEAGPVE